MIIYGNAYDIFSDSPLVTPAVTDDIENPSQLGSRRPYMDDQKTSHMWAYQVGHTAVFCPRWEFSRRGDLITGAGGDVDAYTMVVPVQPTSDGTGRPDLGPYRSDNESDHWISLEVRLYAEEVQQKGLSCDVQIDAVDQPVSWTRTMGIGRDQEYPSRAVVRMPISNPNAPDLEYVTVRIENIAVHSAGGRLDLIEIGPSRYGGDHPYDINDERPRPYRPDQSGMDAGMLAHGNIASSRRDLHSYTSEEDLTVWQGNSDLVGELPDIDGSMRWLSQGGLDPVVDRLDGPSDHVGAVSLDDDQTTIGPVYEDPQSGMQQVKITASQYVAGTTCVSPNADFATSSMLSILSDEMTGLSIDHWEDRIEMSLWDTGSLSSTDVLAGVDAGDWYDVTVVVRPSEAMAYVWVTGVDGPVSVGLTGIIEADISMYVGSSPIRDGMDDHMVAWPHMTWCHEDRHLPDVLGYMESYRAYRSMMCGLE